MFGRDDARGKVVAIEYQDLGREPIGKSIAEFACTSSGEAAGAWYVFVLLVVFEVGTNPVASLFSFAGSFGSRCLGFAVHRPISTRFKGILQPDTLGIA